MSTLTKGVEQKDLLPGKELRSISQRALLAKLDEHEKIGVVMNDELSIAMIKWDKYEALLNRVEELESQIEDYLLATHMAASVERAERGEMKEYPVNSLADVLQMID